MSETLKIILTVFGGIVVFVAGQITVKFFIEPYHAYKKLVGEIAHSLIFYDDATNRKNTDDAKIILRKQASQLMSTANIIPMYRIWAFFRMVPNYDDLNKASSNLIGMSNSLKSDSNSKRRREIAKQLRIKVIAKRFGN